MEDVQTYVRNLVRRARRFGEEGATERLTETRLEERNAAWLDGYKFALLHHSDEAVINDRERLLRGEDL